MGQRDLRRLLISGAMTVVTHAVRRGEATDPWLAGMLARKPKKLVAVALANKMARTVWALATKKETGFALPPDRAEKGEEARKAKTLSGRCGQQDAGPGKGKRSTRRDRKNQCMLEGL